MFLISINFKLVNALSDFRHIDNDGAPRFIVFLFEFFLLLIKYWPSNKIECLLPTGGGGECNQHLGQLRSCFDTFDVYDAFYETFYSLVQRKCS